MQRLILASGSPRRRELLTRIGIPFDVMVSDIDEELGEHIHAETFAMIMSRDKARGVAAKLAKRHGLEEVRADDVPEPDQTGDAKAGDAKAGDAQATAEGYLVLAADTVVARDGHILGKPKNRGDALRMLRLLSGGWHEVITGITLIRTNTGEEQTAAEITRVKFRDADEDYLARYADTAEPYDKAGAYGIQGYGVFLVERIEGDYHNVMGLPLHRLSRMLEGVGIGPLSWLK